MGLSHKASLMSVVWLVILFVVAPFYTHPNIGGLGFGLPFNFAEWSVALLFVCVIFFKLARNNILVYHRGFIYCLLFPLALIFIGIASDVSNPVVWFFRQLYIIGGVAFLFALFQLKLNTRQIEQVLYVLVIATFIQGLVGLCQIWHVRVFNIWLPREANDLPFGLFQQVNLQASYLVTGLLIILYLISRPSFHSARFVTKFLFIITFALAVYIIISTGSRVGILSLVLASGSMLLSRKKQLFHHKQLMMMLVVVSVLSSLAAQSGFSHALEKTVKMTDNQHASARQTMYAIGLDLIKDKPVFGYGIGSFPRVWADKTIIFAKNNPQATIIQLSAGHPHNEILLWLIEGGLLAGIGLLVVFGVICVSLYRCGYSRGGAYLALLLPITLHTQVELPFYVSSVHWFLWLFLIYMVFRHQLLTAKNKLSQAAKYFVQLSVVIIALSGMNMLLHIKKSEREIFHYVNGKDIYLETALNDLYFNSIAEKLMMRRLLDVSIETDDVAQVKVFIDWAEELVLSDPEWFMFLMLMKAYDSIADKENQCRTAQYALSIYTQRKEFLDVVRDCKKLEN